MIIAFVNWLEEQAPGRLATRLDELVATVAEKARRGLGGTQPAVDVGGEGGGNVGGLAGPRPGGLGARASHASIGSRTSGPGVRVAAPIRSVPFVPTRPGPRARHVAGAPNAARPGRGGRRRIPVVIER